MKKKWYVIVVPAERTDESGEEACVTRRVSFGIASGVSEEEVVDAAREAASDLFPITDGWVLFAPGFCEIPETILAKIREEI